MPEKTATRVIGPYSGVRGGDSAYEFLQSHVGNRVLWKVQKTSTGGRPKFEFMVTDLQGRALEDDLGLTKGAFLTFTSERAARKAFDMITKKKLAAETGDGTSVGLFFPLPEIYRGAFAEKEEDPSKPHVTLLYVGDVPKERREELVELLTTFFRYQVNGPAYARMSELDYFRSQTGAVAFSKVVFSNDMANVKDRVISLLEDHGFQIADSHPLSYTPHVTLEYLPSPDGLYDGPVPVGAWLVDRVEIWGLPEVRELALGPMTELEKKASVHSAPARRAPWIRSRLPSGFMNPGFPVGGPSQLRALCDRVGVNPDGRIFRQHLYAMTGRVRLNDLSDDQSQEVAEWLRERYRRNDPPMRSAQEERVMRKRLAREELRKKWWGGE